MKAQYLLILMVVFVSLIVGGCALQPLAQAQANIDVEFTLKSAQKGGKMVFVGVGGEIDGQINPDLPVQRGETIHLILINGDGVSHDLKVPGLRARLPNVQNKGNQSDAVFEARDAGVYEYYCTVMGHRKAGMEGALTVSEL